VTAEAAVYVSRFSAWAPGLDSPGAWREWAAGRREIDAAGEGPALGFTEPLFRRRLSRISRMTIQVLHELLPLGEAKVLFFSFRGEIAQQLRINRGLVEERAVSPAAFSLSVFNTPVALASIVLNLPQGYSAVYPGDGRFATGLLAAAAPLLSPGGSGAEAREMVAVYADEPLPAEYEPLLPGVGQALALGAVLSRRESPGALPLDAADDASPEAFLRSLLERRVPYGAP
jgi:hypothetical protein